MYRIKSDAKLKPCDWCRRSATRVVLTTAIAVVAAPALATEGGGNTYPIGVNTVLSGVLPPPGETRYFDYAQHYEADELDNGNGQSRIPGFWVEAYVNAARPLHTWRETLGPFSVTSVIVVPLVDIKLKVGAREKAISGVGDIDLQPALLAWKNKQKTLFFSFGPGVYVPTGLYSATRLVNTGRNQVVYFGQANMTWFVTPRLEFSVGNTIEAAAVNQTTHYKSGGDITTDYELTYTPAQNLSWIHLGVNGYAYKQFESDSIRGIPVVGGNEGQVIAVGPTGRFEFGRYGFVVKWDHEFAVENRPRGERVWFQFTVPLSRQTRPAPPSAPPTEK